MAGRLVLAFLVAIALLLAFVPWQQSVPATGRVLALSPTDREQQLHAPIEGRITAWHVGEGSRVEAGEPVVEIEDVDPDYVARLKAARDATVAQREAARQRAEAHAAQARSYEEARRLQVNAAELKVQIATQSLAAERQRQEAAEAALHTSARNVDRLRGLLDKHLVSARDLELAELERAKVSAELSVQQTRTIEAETRLAAYRAEVLQIDAEARAKIAEARAELAKAEADAAKATGDVARSESALSRQGARLVRAPMAGTVLSIDGNEGGGIVKAGHPLALLLPQARSRAVELYVDGNDAPLVAPGRRVRLQFEGWPAVQFAGWPSVAVGTFGGTVSFVAPASLKDGQFRAIVVPDETSQSWPSPEHLRQGVRVKAWVLLDEVRLGWELWRRFNGFPAAIQTSAEDRKR